MNFDFLIAMSPCWRRSRDEVNFVGPRSSEFRGAGQQSTQARVDDAGASDVEKCDREVGSEGTAIEGEHAARVVPKSPYCEETRQSSPLSSKWSSVALIPLTTVALSSQSV